MLPLRQTAPPLAGKGAFCLCGREPQKARDAPKPRSEKSALPRRLGKGGCFCVGGPSEVRVILGTRGLVLFPPQLQLAVEICRLCLALGVKIELD